MTNPLKSELSVLVRTLYTCFIVCASLFQCLASGTQLVYQIDIREEISPGMARQVSKAMNEARTAGATSILIEMNTYGGLLDAADSIRTLLLNSPIPVYVLIDNNAASAGALIAIACNKIYMREGASIGAATVVTSNAEALPDKYQSFMRSMMRATAEARKRNPKVAEAMVDGSMVVEGLNDSGKVVTLTSREAVQWGFCDGIANDARSALRQAGITDYKLIRFQPTWLDRFIGFLVHPAVSGVLILLMLGGLYYELQQPGIGFPLIVALAGAVLYFAPLYLEGLAENWEILIAFIGIVLIGLEIFIIPGFGIAGISGISLLLFGLTSSLLNNDGLDYSGVSGYAFIESIAVVLTGIAGALALFILASKVFAESPVFKKMVLATEMNAAAGYSAAIDLPAPGTRGTASTLLRPSGKVKIGDQQYTASSESGFIEAGTAIEVIAVSGGNLVVREAN